MTWNYNREAAAHKSLLAMAKSTNGRLATADERNQLFRPSSSTAFHSTMTTCNSFFYLSAAASSSNDNDNNNEDDDTIILNSIQSYLQSFPFAAVLPVQPLTYKPRKRRSSGDDDIDGVLGVDVIFIRKKW